MCVCVCVCVCVDVFFTVYVCVCVVCYCLYYRSGLEERFQQLIRLHAEHSAVYGGGRTDKPVYNVAAVWQRLRGPAADASQQLLRKQFLSNLVSELGLYIPREYAKHLWMR